MSELVLFYHTNRLENLPDRLVRFSGELYALTAKDLPKPEENDMFIFLGWFIDPEYETPCEVGDEVSEDTVLYGKWEPISDEGKILVGHPHRRFQLRKDRSFNTYPIVDDDETRIIDEKDNKAISEVEYQGYLVRIEDPDRHNELLNFCAKDVLTYNNHSMAEILEVVDTFDIVVNVHDSAY